MYMYVNVWQAATASTSWCNAAWRGVAWSCTVHCVARRGMLWSNERVVACVACHVDPMHVCLAQVQSTRASPQAHSILSCWRGWCNLHAMHVRVAATTTTATTIHCYYYHLITTNTATTIATRITTIDYSYYYYNNYYCSPATTTTTTATPTITVGYALRIRLLVRLLCHCL